MNLQSNGPAAVSLGLGIGAFALVVVATCLGSVPVLSLLNFVVLPLQLALAFFAIVSGIVGFRTASALYGTGRGAALSGFGLGAISLGARLFGWLFGLI